MNVFITTPAFGRHGGIRILIEIANRLSKFHDVYLHSITGNDGADYWNIDKKIKLVGESMKGMDCLIITSPHSIDFQNKVDRPEKVFLHCQMAEHLFNPGKIWQTQCRRFYQSIYPMMSISQWNINTFRKVYNRKATTHYIGNGINLKDFPLLNKPKDFKTVLVEGWEATNPAKDVFKVAPKVAKRLKDEGYRIVSYGQAPLRNFADVTEHHLNPTLEEINQLYEEATILLKASKYDARSCSPIEAMTKGTPTARSIMLGDDDLIHGFNCLRTPYNETLLYKAAKEMLTNQELFKTLQEGCKETIKRNDWDIHINKINEIING